MISIVYGSPAAGSPNNWAATSADLANDVPNIGEVASETYRFKIIDLRSWI
jgi:hypothetical protein